MGISTTPLMDSARSLASLGQQKAYEGVVASDPLVQSLSMVSAQQAVQIAATITRVQDDLEHALLDILV